MKLKKKKKKFKRNEKFILGASNDEIRVNGKVFPEFPTAAIFVVVTSRFYTKNFRKVFVRI